MTSEDGKPSKPSRRLTARSAARLAAVQGLYQMDIAGTDVNEVIDEFVNHRFCSDDAEEALVAYE